MKHRLTYKVAFGVIAVAVFIVFAAMASKSTGVKNPHSQASNSVEVQTEVDNGYLLHDTHDATQPIENNEQATTTTEKTNSSPQTKPNALQPTQTPKAPQKVAGNTNTTTGVKTTLKTNDVYPSSSNTGPLAAFSHKSGDLTITKDGTVLDGYDISGSLSIVANNVTVKNTRIRNSGYFVVSIKGKGAVVQNCEIDGMGNGHGSGGIIGSGTFRNNNIHGVENGIVPESNSVITDSYIHDLKASGDPHYDGIQMDGGQKNIVIRHNTVDLGGLSQTAAIMIDNYFGPIDTIVIDNNKLSGGGYILYVDGSFNSQVIENVSIINNRFGNGHYGDAVIRGSLKNIIKSGNKRDGSGALIQL